MAIGVHGQCSVPGPSADYPRKESPIMIKIDAIRESDGDRLHREFFRPEFIDYRLGRPGHWQGSAAGKLGLTGPVEPGVFEKLLEGRSPEGETLLRPAVAQPNRVLGWRISVAADASTSVLWALAPPVVRGRIVTAHADAIRLALGEVERHLNGRPWIENPNAPGRISTLTAKFHSGASSQQIPRLETNVFLFNLVFQTGKENASFTREQATGQGRLIHSAYQRALRSEITRAIGANAKLSSEFTLRFEEHPPGSGKSHRSDWAQRVPSRELFDRWQEQALKWGWGPQRTTEMIRESKSRLTMSNLIEDARTLGRLWAIAVGHPAHSPQRVGEVLAQSRSRSDASTVGSRDHDKGMSH